MFICPHLHAATSICYHVVLVPIRRVERRDCWNRVARLLISQQEARFFGLFEQESDIAMVADALYGYRVLPAHCNFHTGYCDAMQGEIILAGMARLAELTGMLESWSDRMATARVCTFIARRFTEL